MFDSVDSYYKFHSKIYDLTRWSILFGRDEIHNHLPSLSGGNLKILDLGCGTGRQLLKLAKRYPNAQITGLDASKEMLEKASVKLNRNDRIDLINNSIQSFLPTADKYDLIFCSYSLSIIKDYSNLFELLKHSMKRHGIISVVDFDKTPFESFEKWMALNHVSVDGKLFKELSRSFKPKFYQTRKAYGGLWSYTIFIGSE
ncbi:MAG: class I SAM-dependent methyltransferase [Balneola sp.]